MELCLSLIWGLEPAPTPTADNGTAGRSSAVSAGCVVALKKLSLRDWYADGGPFGFVVTERCCGGAGSGLEARLEDDWGI